MSDDLKIYIGSILLEMNRWAQDKTPTYRVSEWADRFVEAGFDGIELWEYHATLCDDAEGDALAASPCPVTIFNSYASMGDEDEARRRQAVDLTAKFGATGVKFNVGPEPADREMYIRNLRAWRDMFGPEVTLLCECHPGTIIEEPGAAKAFFDEVDREGIEIIVHAFHAVDTLQAWFDAFGSKISHAHLQSRDGRELIRFDEDAESVDKALGIMKSAGFAGSVTLEFTGGTLADDENIDMLYANALADLACLKGKLG